MSAQRLLITLVLWLASCAGSAWLGWDYRDGKVAQEKLDAVTEQTQLFEEATTQNEALKTELSAARSALADVNLSVAKEVIRYVQVTPANQRCTLPGTWRVRHDAAATGISPDAEAGSVAIGRFAAVEDATALATVADNYAIARECASKLDGWKRRYRENEE